MISTTAICDQYAWLYTTLAVPAGTWDHLIPVDGAYAAVKRVAGVDYVMFRGSVTPMDWLEDLEHFALPVLDELLGLVHPGFRKGVMEIQAPLDDLVGDYVIAVGHSLGAGHAALYAAYRRAQGKPVDGLVMFGEPKPAADRVAQLLAGVSVQSFRNADKSGHDYVTDVPFTLLPEFPYRHVKEPLTDVWHSPRADDPWLAFRYHHFGHYCRAFGCGGVAALSLPT